MPYSMSLEQQQRPIQTLKQMQRMIMTRQMQQAISLLQMPAMEIAPIVEIEMQQNPILEYLDDDSSEDIESQILEEEIEEESLDNDVPAESALKFDERDFDILRRLDEDFKDYFSESGEREVRSVSQREKLQTFLESSITEQPTLFQHLMRQAHEAFQSPEDLAICEALIGNLDQFGFFSTPLKEIATMLKCPLSKLEEVLKVIQSFHPVGIGAVNLQESLLLQLRAQSKQNLLAYAIVEKHFDDLLHNRIPNIKKGLRCTTQEIGEMIDLHISKLDLHPGSQLSRLPISYIAPDVSLCQEGDELKVVVNDEIVPRLHLNRGYLKMLEDENLNDETKDFIKKKIVSAKWLLRNLMQRSSTLEKIAQVLASRQHAFFASPNGELIPMTMKEMADELSVHESTVARAVANKYIDSPRGLLPLRSFFTTALITHKGEEISSKTVRDMLKDIVAEEDTHHPYSDEAISSLMKEKGIKCARRTVAKYRAALKIGSAQQRRKF